MNTLTEHEGARSTFDLINQALIYPDEDECESRYWQAIWALRERPTAEVFEAARALCQSDCPQEQAVGCTVLAQLGAPEMPFAIESFPVVVSVLTRTENGETLTKAISALGWLRDLRAVRFVLPFAQHPDPHIRYWVTHSLIALGDDPRSVGALITLTGDSCVEVRDWSTFGLGTLLDQHDSSEIRDALLARLDDSDRTTRGEAMVGLAIRKDIRVVEAVNRELSGDVRCELAFEAAEKIADPRCLPSLLRIREVLGGGDDPYLQRAIEACRDGR